MFWIALAVVVIVTGPDVARYYHNKYTPSRKWEDLEEEQRKERRGGNHVSPITRPSHAKRRPRHYLKR